MLPEFSRRHVSFAIRILDDVTGLPLAAATPRVPAADRNAIAKSGGFYVFTDLLPGTHVVEISSSRYQQYTFTAQTPVAAGTASRVARIPGENERILPVQSVHAASGTVRIASTDFHPGFAADSPVIHQGGQTTLAAPVRGEGVDELELASVTGIAADQFIRVLGEPAIRLRPGPYYDLSRESPPSRRLAGSVRDAVTSVPVAGARLEIRRANGEFLNAHTLGPTPTTTADFSSIGIGPGLRVVGKPADIVAITDERGRFAFRFAPRPELVVDSVGLRVTATGYNLLDTPDIDLTHSDETLYGPVLTPS
jgi:hypothetical protein